MWDVKLKMRDGSTLRVRVSATNENDAEYRAAMKAETARGAVSRVIFCRKVEVLNHD